MLSASCFMYEVYGLTISSEFEIQELNSCNPDSPIDVVVKFANLGLIKNATEVSFSFSENQQTIVLPAVGAFVINGLNSVLVEPKSGVGHDFLAVPFLGPVLAILLYSRGLFVLHGSAIVRKGLAYGFLGDKGAGKSTLAAMLLNNENVELLTDDLLVVNKDFEVLCGYSQLKLSDEALGYSNQNLGHVRPPPIEQFPKNQFLLKKRATFKSVPMGGIFELKRDTGARIEAIPISEAIRVLLRFSYIARFTDRLVDPSEKQNLFSLASNIASTQRVNRIYVPDCISKLKDVIRILN